MNRTRSGAATPSQPARIPVALQAVFLSGNRGLTVDNPPPQRQASKTFRGWLGRTFSSDSTKSKACKENIPPKLVTKPTAIRKKKTTATPTLSPQQYLDAMIGSRGYSVVKFASLSSAYYNKPTSLQEASYGVYLLDLVKQGNAKGLQAALAAGLSTNPANSFGESILHNICRRGDVEMLDVMLTNGCDVQIADDYGRTPLHDACWAAEPAFQVVEKLMVLDIRLFFMTDSRGALPLSYVRKEHWGEWLQFLESKKETYWPRGGIDSSSPALTGAPNTRTAPEPKIALTVELARMVAAGRMTPSEATFLNADVPDGSEGTDSGDDDDDDDDDDSSAGSDDDDSSSNPASCGDTSWNADEMREILENIACPRSRPLNWSK